MSEFQAFIYSNSQVARAGERLASDLIWTPETEAETREIFEIANNWRDSHAFLPQKLCERKHA